VRDDRIVRLRGRIRAEADPKCREDEVRISIMLADGRRVERHVDHAIGSIERPLSDDQLESKFDRQAAPTIGEEATRRLIDIAWALPALADAGEIARWSVRQRGAMAEPLRERTG
jgi:2-methylcitrate dehydratase PrpD